MQLKEIITALEEFAPLSLQAEYDNSGLQCGNREDDITSVLLCIDVTEDIIDEAIQGKHNLVISHHPLIMQGIKKITSVDYIQRCLIKAIKHNINIYAAHTNMDSVMHGVSGRMADKLGLTNRKLLQPEGKLYSLAFYTPANDIEKVRNAVLNTGAGHIGNYSRCSFNHPGLGTFLPDANAHPYCGSPGKLHAEEEIKTEITVPEHLLASCIATLQAVHPYEEPVCNIFCLKNINPTTGFGIIGELDEATDSLEFLRHVKNTFNCGVIRHTDICKPKVKRIAVCGGSGASLTKFAIAGKADIYITGDFKYHDFFNTENQLILADIGHYESEQFTKDIFYELVTKKIPKFAVQFSGVRTNPVNYL